MSKKRAPVLPMLGHLCDDAKDCTLTGLIGTSCGFAETLHPRVFNCMNGGCQISGGVDIERADKSTLQPHRGQQHGEGWREVCSTWWGDVGREHDPLLGPMENSIPGRGGIGVLMEARSRTCRTQNQPSVIRTITAHDRKKVIRKLRRQLQQPSKPSKPFLPALQG